MGEEEWGRSGGSGGMEVIRGEGVGGIVRGEIFSLES